MKKKNGHHLKNIGHINLIFHVHFFINYFEYEVSTIKPVARRDCPQTTMMPDDDTQRIIHDCTDS